MKEVLQKKTLFVVIPLLIALLSVFVLSGPASSPDLHGSTLAALEEKQTTVLELSAASAAASAAITLIPGDVATPIADKLEKPSSAGGKADRVWTADLFGHPSQRLCL